MTATTSERITAILGTEDWLIVHEGHHLATAEDLTAMEAATAAPSDTDHAADVKAWIDKTLALPMYQNAISEYGQGVVETLRTVRKLLNGGMHPDTRAALDAARLTPQPEQVTTGSADAKAILGGCDETADCTASTHSSRCWRGHWVTPEGEKR